MREALVNPWLLVAWPGMGNVAVTAAQYLVDQLGAEKLLDLRPGDHFEVDRVTIENGVARTGWQPTLTLYGWKNPDEGRDLLIFVGEGQPTQRGYEFCRQLLEVAQRYEVSRVFTFAAVATQIHPQQRPRVLGVANDERLLDDPIFEQIQRLNDGHISGLNGVTLAAAADAGLDAICLLGEVPFFAVAVPNPKAALETLRVFSRAARFRIALGELGSEAAAYEEKLTNLVDRSRNAIAPPSEFDPNGLDEGEFGSVEDTPDPDSAISRLDRNRIESLFDEASIDRAKAMDLKVELDRLGAFGEYEDRFLDLFTNF